jgi:hypothetical protein
MAVYAKAHTHTFTEANIRAAFAKTEIVPYNPNVVMTDMMAPSFTTSTTSHLPLGLATPVRKIVDLISHHNACKQKRQEFEEQQSEQPEQGAAASSPPYTPVRHRLASLATTSASFLVSDSPIPLSATLSPLFTRIITPPAQQDAVLLDVEPSTEHAEKLQEALCTSNEVVTLQN